MLDEAVGQRALIPSKEMRKERETDPGEIDYNFFRFYNSSYIIVFRDMDRSVGGWLLLSLDLSEIGKSPLLAWIFLFFPGEMFDDVIVNTAQVNGDKLESPVHATSFG